MIEFRSSRSRIQDGMRCARARYLMHEWFADADGNGGLSPVKVAVPLATGGAVHLGLASLMRRAMEINVHWPGAIETAVVVAVDEFKTQCEGRGLDLGELESQSFVYNEQLALVEGLVRLAGLRVIPRLIEEYEVLEVEVMDSRALVSHPEPYKFVANGKEQDSREFTQSEWSVLWRSIPDALLRSRETGDLFVLSWKTCASYDQQRDQDARTDMQGLSEPWALEGRLAQWYEKLRDVRENHFDTIPVLDLGIPRWFIESYLGASQPSEIRGVQMIYLVKGQRRKDEQDQTYKTQSPLLRGYKKDPSPGLVAPEFVTDLFYTCSEPHPFRYAKGGTCPGGVNHKRTDFEKFNTWETAGGVGAWLELLSKGGAGQQGIDVLDAQWIMTVPHFRPRYMTERWERQTRAMEARTARAIITVREYESALRERRETHVDDAEEWDSYQRALDELFPQTTEKCGDWFSRKCPMWEVCHGPDEVQRDPVGSGLFQVKQQYQDKVGVE